MTLKGYSIKGALLLIVSVLLFSSCATVYKTVPSPVYTKQDIPIENVINDKTLETAVAVAAKYGMLFVNVTDRTKVADYASVYAHALRTITGSPTPEQLDAELNAWIPADIKAKYPSLVSFGASVISTHYQFFYAKLKGNTRKTADYLNRIATGLEYGLSSYITKAVK